MLTSNFVYVRLATNYPPCTMFTHCNVTADARLQPWKKKNVTNICCKSWGTCRPRADLNSSLFFGFVAKTAHAYNLVPLSVDTYSSVLFVASVENERDALCVSTKVLTAYCNKLGDMLWVDVILSVSVFRDVFRCCYCNFHSVSKHVVGLNAVKPVSQYDSDVCERQRESFVVVFC